MKSNLILLLLSFTFIFSSLGCNTNKTDNENKQNNISTTSIKENSITTESSTTITQDSSTSENNIKSSSIDELVLGQPYDVKTEWGDYNFTILSLEKTDWWSRANNNNDKLIILLNMECENISFSNDNFNGLYLDSSAFRVMDNNSYILREPSFSYDINSPALTPIGSKLKFSLAYVAEPNTEFIDVFFTRADKDVAHINLPVK